jgi:hypothetical protein
MDAELALDYKEYRSRFDMICKHTLQNLAVVCESESVELRNLADLDFSYSDSTSAFSVLESLGAEAIHDPLIVAIRDWHRKRSHKES